MYPRTLDLDVVRAFVAIVDLGSFTKAADFVGRTQSTVSLQIQKLEDLLRAQLLHRRDGSIRLTSSGHIFLNYARQILDLQDQAVSCLSNCKSKTKISVGTQESFALTGLPVTLHHYRSINSDVEVHLSCGVGSDILIRLEAGELDLALVRCPTERAGGKILWFEEVCWAGPESSNSISVDPLPLVAFPEGCFMRQFATEALDRARRPWIISHTSANSETVRAAVQSGLGISALAAGSFQPGLRNFSGQLNLPPLPKVAVCLLTNKRNASKAAAELATFLGATLKAPCHPRNHSRTIVQ